MARMKLPKGLRKQIKNSLGNKAGTKKNAKKIARKERMGASFEWKFKAGDLVTVNSRYGSSSSYHIIISIDESKFKRRRAGSIVSETKLYRVFPKIGGWDRVEGAHIKHVL